MKKLLDDKYDNFEFIIVSSLESDGKAYNDEKGEVTEEIKNSQHIRYYESLDNKSVIELIKKSHIGLLPTFSDTFGFSVLEMQACGVPVITTNVNALKEINDDKTGWIIDIDQFKGKYDYNSKADCDMLKDFVVDKLFNIMTEILSDVYISNLLTLKGKECINRIKVNHSEEIYKNQLEKILIHN